MSNSEGSGASGRGCAVSMGIINLVIMGLFAASFVRGPFSSLSQTLFYRAIPLAFLVIAAIIPLVLLFTRVRTRRRAVIALTIGMLTGLLLFTGYVFQAGGGV